MTGIGNYFFIFRHESITFTPPQRSVTYRS